MLTYLIAFPNKLSGDTHMRSTLMVEAGGREGGRGKGRGGNAKLRCYRTLLISDVIRYIIDKSFLIDADVRQ